MAGGALHFPSTLLPAPNLRLRLRLRSLRRLTTTALAAASSSPTEFNISFAPSPPKTLTPAPILIPWIARDDSGSLKLQSSPPARLLHPFPSPQPHTPTPKNPKRPPAPTAAAPGPTPAPKYSKAARRFYNDKFRQTPQRLSKVLAAAGVASRRSSEELIFGGKVTVNGSVCTSPQTRVDVVKDSIYVNGNRLAKKLPPKLYFALNKPKGYICSTGEETKSVVSIFDEYWKSWNKTNPGVPRPRLFTVGRLDVATTGLIFVTNDGDFAQRLAHPSSNVTKEYIATIDGVVHRRHLITISEGTQIEGVKCVPDSVELLPVQPGTSRPRLRIVVHEGRNHEVRELVKNAGLQLHSLKRVRVGGFRLPSNLGLGKYAELKDTEIKLLGGKTQKSI